MRVPKTALLLTLLITLFWSNTGAPDQHSRIATLVLTTQEKQALLEPEAPNTTTTLTFGASLGNIPISLSMAPISAPTVREEIIPILEPEERLVVQSAVEEAPSNQAVAEAPLPQPETKVEPGAQQTTQEVWITFFYCLRTVAMPDDGGGFCWGTASGTLVHPPTPTEPGTAACPPQWDGRTFTIVGDPAFEDGTPRAYRCDDHGSGVTGNHVDIWFETNGEGWSWPLGGRRGTIIWQD